MKQVILSLFLLIILAQSAFSQALAPLAKGEYPTSATDVVAGLGLPETFKVMANIESSSQDAFSMSATSNGNYGNTVKMARFEGNIFAPVDNQGFWITPSKNFVVIYPGIVMEMYVTKGLDNAPEVDRVIAIAPDGAKFGELKKAAKDHAEAFKFAEVNNKLAKANEVLKQKAIDDAAAAKAAAAKAAEDKKIADAKAKADREAKAVADAEQAKAAEADADLCTPLNRYFKMAATNFKEIQGKLDAEETELEEEDVFNTTEILPLLKRGLIIPTWKEGVKKVQFFSHFHSQADADAHLAKIKAKLDACYKNKGGFTYNVDSDIHFYKSATVSMELMRSTDSGSDYGDYKVLIQITKK
ncbi:MAG TPA: hypothetical protein VHS96_14875 [Bacteroidia bacterium]|nr:hypothetical protein [Bacteroidia bacterium]